MIFERSEHDDNLNEKELVEKGKENWSQVPKETKKMALEKNTFSQKSRE